MITAEYSLTKCHFSHPVWDILPPTTWTILHGVHRQILHKPQSKKKDEESEWPQWTRHRDGMYSLFIQVPSLKPLKIVLIICNVVCILVECPVLTEYVQDRPDFVEINDLIIFHVGFSSVSLKIEETRRGSIVAIITQTKHTKQYDLKNKPHKWTWQRYSLHIFCMWVATPSCVMQGLPKIFCVSVEWFFTYCWRIQIVNDTELLSNSMESRLLADRI